MAENKKKVLLKNTIMLYILTFSNYLLSFIVVPYETRVLGPEAYGLIGLATSIMVYFQLFIDFGFLISATEEVANSRENKQKLSLIFSSVTINKLILSLISLAVLLVLCFSISRWREHILFLMLFCLSTAIGSLLPDYMYRGIERMGTITVRTILIKLFFTLMIFILVKEPKDYIYIPILNVIGNLGALIATYIHLRSMDIKFTSCRLKDILSRMKTSSIFFMSRIASTAYTAANTIILDFLSGGAMTGFYTSADKLVSTAKNGISPISDSLYPYMVKNKDFKLIKKVILVLEPIIILGCAILFIWANPICIWLFGDEYGYVGDVLRTMLPAVVFILPSYILGFPVLGAMGMNKHANYSVIVGSCIHIVNLLVMYFAGVMNIITLGFATSVAEGIVLIYRIIVVIKNKDKLRNGIR
ncbi:MAG: oligosaccharide flippase family protein [Clostridia bacterium]|nr:oligosaccharide flippase family protein [Clostridia bacterium]